MDVIAAAQGIFQKGGLGTDTDYVTAAASR